MSKLDRSSTHSHPTLLTRVRRYVSQLWSRLPHRSTRRNRGQGMVEFALILPVLLLVMLGTIEFGYVFTVYTGMFNAAREGTRFGAVNPKDLSGIDASARGKIILVDPSAVAIESSYDEGPTSTVKFTDPAEVQIGDRVLLTIIYDLPTITPVIQPIVSSFRIETQAARTVVSLGDSFDSDGDGIPNSEDNCPYNLNPSQSDADGDGVGDACDQASCPNDADCDGVTDDVDNCPNTSNPDQADADGNGVGDACDGGGGGGGGGGGSDDSDFDGVLDPDDNCPYVFNPDQADSDGDGIGDVCEIGISLSVAADPQTVIVQDGVGELVTFVYTVTNTGVMDLDVVIEDSFGRSISVGTLAAGATHVETVVEDINMTTTNDVTATGTDLQPTGGTVSDSDSVVVTATGPALRLTVEVNPQTILPGELVTFTYTVENVGDVDLATVIVWDTLGSSLAPYNNLAVGGTTFWQVLYHVNATVNVDVTAVGSDSGGVEVARDTGNVVVTVIETLAPIVISEPLYESDTVVTGWAHAERTVYIRDLMSDTFPHLNATVGSSGTFEFAGLPPLVAGHVIVVEGYGRWDSAVVGTVGGLDPIVINGPLCHGGTTIVGTAESGQDVTLVITDAGYQDSTTVDANGYFTFSLPASQPLQTDQVVGVNGYGESASATVVECVTDAYLTIAPQCGPSGPTVITVKGHNWSFKNKNDDVNIYWGADDQLVGTYDTPNGPPDPWSQDITGDVTGSGIYTITATNENSSVSAFATFLSPCPSPNLVIADLSLITTTRTITANQVITDAEGVTTTVVVTSTTDAVFTHEPVHLNVVVENIGTQSVNSMFWVDLYSADPTPETTGVAWAAVNGLNAGESVPLTITLKDGFAITGTHQLWAFTDSWYQVSELDENDNDYGPITVEVSEEGVPPPSPPVSTTVGSIAGETWVSLTGIPVPHGRANVYVYQEDILIASTVSDDSARYEFTDLPVGTYTVIGETWINGIRYSNSYEVQVLDGQTTVRFIIMYRS